MLEVVQCHTKIDFTPAGPEKLSTIREAEMTIGHADVRKQIELLQRLEQQKKFNRFKFWTPYQKQRQFLAAGAVFRERGLMAANRVGKTETGAYEMACHLTGDYPDDWEGRRFDHPVRAWCAGETSLLTRDVSQSKLFGRPGISADLGTGMVPKMSIVDKPSLSKVADFFDTVQVQHCTRGRKDGISTVTFKSYEQGREKFQGEKIDVLWLDEEPDMKIYMEGYYRIAGGGIMYSTFTPLKMRTPVTDRFLREDSPDRIMVNMSLHDAEHLSKDEINVIIQNTPKHLLDARVYGRPGSGGGNVFPYSIDIISEPMLEYIPEHWTKIIGIDFGIAHPFAAVLLIWDRDQDVIHVHQAYRQSDVQPIHHATRIKAMGASVPIAWPQDGTARESNGQPLASIYKQHGLLMLPTHATFPDGSISTEAGVLEMDQRMTTGRLKVARHLNEWFEEFADYHRKEDGTIDKVRDDIMSATRVGIMAKRFSRAVPIGNFVARKRWATMARDVDFDPFTPGD